MRLRDDYGSHTVHDAAAADLYMGLPDSHWRPDIGDVSFATHSGRCGGCGFHVDTSHPGGACIHKRGPWHPVCRDADRAAPAEIREAA